MKRLVELANLSIHLAALFYLLWSDEVDPQRVSHIFAVLLASWCAVVICNLRCRDAGGNEHG